MLNWWQPRQTPFDFPLRYDRLRTAKDVSVSACPMYHGERHEMQPVRRGSPRVGQASGGLVECV